MNSIRHTARIFLVILVLLSAIPGLSEKKIIESKWAAQPLKIDGLNDDWDGDALFPEKGSKVEYAVRNDAQNLYVLLVFKDPKSLSTINSTGITLYFGPEGKKTKDNGVHFVKRRVKPDELIASLEKEGEVLTEAQKQEIKSKPALIMFAAEMVGKKGQEAPETAPSPGALRPGFKTAQNDNEIIYEFRVPLARSTPYHVGVGAEPGQNITIGFEWGGMTEEMRQEMNARARAESGRGGVTGESSAGNMIIPGRGDTRPPQDSSMAVPKKYSFWAEVKLAQNQ